METMLSTILGALVGSFSAAAFSYIYHERKSKQQLKINCRLLLDEAIKHATWLNQERLYDEFQIIKFSKVINIEVWDILKTELHGMKFDQYDVVRQHFKDMREIKYTIQNHKPQKPIYPFPDDLLNLSHDICEKTVIILANICELSNDQH